LSSGAPALGDRDARIFVVPLDVERVIRTIRDRRRLPARLLQRERKFPKRVQFARKGDVLARFSGRKGRIKFFNSVMPQVCGDRHALDAGVAVLDCEIDAAHVKIEGKRRMIGSFREGERLDRLGRQHGELVPRQVYR